MYCEKFGCKTKLEEGAKFCPKCGTPVKMPNFLAAIAYVPGGFIFIITGLFNKDKFVKFHSLQALVYWIFWIIFLYPFVWIVEVTVSLGSIASAVLMGSYILLMYFILPIVYAIKAYKGQVFYVPFFGKLLANLFNEMEQQVNQQNQLNQPNNSQKSQPDYQSEKLEKKTILPTWTTVLIVVMVVAIVSLASYIVYQNFVSKPVEPTELLITEEETTPPLLPSETAKEVFAKVLYRKGDNLILFNPLSKEKTTILSHIEIIDFDLSNDGKFIAYSLRETGFEGNSDIYLKNLETGKITRLGQKNNIASFNPKILPDNSKVLYVRREYSPSTGKLSDGEIWIIDSNGDIESSKKLFSSLKIEGLETEEYCASEEEKKSVKIGIQNISPDSKTLVYWKKNWGAECSGLWQYPYFSNFDGSDFFTEKFKQQNTFIFDTPHWEQKEFNWEPHKIFWFSDSNFVIGQSAPIPIAGEAIYYYDKDQNKKWEIFDSFKQNARKYDTQVSIDGILKKDHNDFIIVYNAYKRAKDIKYFVENIKFGEKIDLANLDNKKYFDIDNLNNPNDDFFKVKLLNENTLIYEKQLDKNKFGLYLYNITTGVEEKIDEFNSRIEFDL